MTATINHRLILRIVTLAMVFGYGALVLANCDEPTYTGRMTVHSGTN